MIKRFAITAGLLMSLAMVQAPALAQGQFEKKSYSYSEWTKGRFAEVVTVVNPGKWIFLGGIGSEREGDGAIIHKGDFLAQCKYAWEKITKLLALNGATPNDIVRTTNYVTDIRHRQLLVRCFAEAVPGVPPPASTLLNVSQLAQPDMMVEIDVIAVTAK